MALVTCPECRSQVSSRASSCPRCGLPFRRSSGKKKNKKRSPLATAAYIVLPVGIGCLAAYLVYGPKPFQRVADKAVAAYEQGLGPEGEAAVTSTVESAPRKLGQLARKLNSKLKKALSAASGKQGLHWEVSFPFLEKDTLFPALHHLCGRKVAGFSSTFAEIEVTNNTDKDLSALRVEVELEGFSKPASEVIDLPLGSSEKVRITPTIDEKIASLTEERPGHIRVSIKDAQGKLLKEKRHQIIIASRNDLSRASFAYPLSAVFVTPNDPVIQELVTEARRRLGTLRGYQGPPDQVQKEVGVVYEMLSDLGIGYRSAATSFINDRGMSGQKIYFPAESVAQTSANCIDGCALFASVLEKMGLRPVFVLVPGHVFLGVELVKGRPDQMLFLETTLIGRASFAQSVRAGGVAFRKAKGGKFSAVSIAKCRKMGITPFPLRVGKPERAVRQRLAASRRARAARQPRRRGRFR